MSLLAQHVQGVTVVVAAALLLASPALAEDEAPFDGRKNVEQFWESKGVAPHVAAGIADRVQIESNFNPEVKGDGNSSLGLYQHHADRLKTLLANVENDQAFREVTSTDKVAAARWNEIKAAPDRATAAKLWDRYFERSAASRRAAPGPTRQTAAVTTPRPASQPAGSCMASYMGVCLSDPRAVATMRRLASSAPPMPGSRPYQPQPPPAMTAPTYRPAVPQTAAVVALLQFFHHRK